MNCVAFSIAIPIAKVRHARLKIISTTLTSFLCNCT
nr:MAG TPA: hypothetical protein [Caudoviricetes sp.]